MIRKQHMELLRAGILSIMVGQMAKSVMIYERVRLTYQRFRFTVQQ